MPCKQQIASYNIWSYAFHVERYYFKFIRVCIAELNIADSATCKTIKILFVFGQNEFLMECLSLSGNILILNFLIILYSGMKLPNVSTVKQIELNLRKILNFIIALLQTKSMCHYILIQFGQRKFSQLLKNIAREDIIWNLRTLH